MRNAGLRCLLGFAKRERDLDSACEKVARTLYCVNQFPANATKMATNFAHSVIFGSQSPVNSQIEAPNLPLVGKRGGWIRAGC